MEALDARQAARAAARMNCPASQALGPCPWRAMDEVYQRLGLVPATDEEFTSLVDEMGLPDGEG